MGRVHFYFCALGVLFSVQAAPAQTYEELKRENEQLRARIKALEAERGVEGVVVSYDHPTGKLVVKVGEQERAIVLAPRSHVHDPDGYEVRGTDRIEKLKPGVKLEIVEKDGRLIEINLIGPDGRRRGHRHDLDHRDAHSDHDYFKKFHSHAEEGHSRCPRYEQELCAQPPLSAPSHRHTADPHVFEIKSFCDKRSWHKEDNHAHGHANGHNGRNGHGSVEGYPFIHLNRIEPAWLHRALEFRFAYARNADGGELHETELEAEWIWALNNRVELVAAMPYLWLRATDGSGTESGFGDLELAVNFLAFNGERMKLKVGLAVTLPTGSESRGLSDGHTILEPTAFWLLDFGHGWVMQGEAALELPLSTDNVENLFRYGVGIGKICLATQHWTCFRWLTPVVEFNGLTTLNGPESGRTVIDVTPGLRWIVRERDGVGFGVSFPITGSKEFDWQIIFKYSIHF